MRWLKRATGWRLSGLFRGPQPGCFIGQQAGLGCVFECGVELLTQEREFCRTEQALQALEELAFFPADVIGQAFGGCGKIVSGKTACFTLCEVVSESGMIGEQVLDQRHQFCETSRFWKEDTLLRREVGSYFALEQLAHLSIPGGEIGLRDRCCAINAHAQRQRALVLMRERNQVLVAQHDLLGRQFDVCDGVVYSWTQRKPIGAHAFPLLDQHAVGFEEGADAITLPSGDFLKNRCEHGERTAA